jgi:hypothetical protein
LIAWGNGNSRSPGAKRAQSGTDLSYCRLLHDHPAAHAGAGSARSRAISDKISENSQRGTATSASRTVTEHPWLTMVSRFSISCVSLVFRKTGRFYVPAVA